MKEERQDSEHEREADETPTTGTGNPAAGRADDPELHQYPRGTGAAPREVTRPGTPPVVGPGSTEKDLRPEGDLPEKIAS